MKKILSIVAVVIAAASGKGFADQISCWDHTFAYNNLKVNTISERVEMILDGAGPDFGFETKYYVPTSNDPAVDIFNTHRANLLLSFPAANCNVDVVNQNVDCSLRSSRPGQSIEGKHLFIQRRIYDPINQKSLNFLDQVYLEEISIQLKGKEGFYSVKLVSAKGDGTLVTQEFKITTEGEPFCSASSGGAPSILPENLVKFIERRD